MRTQRLTPRQRAVWALPVLVVGVIALPLFTDRTFGYDWPDHLWLVWQQAQSIAQLGHPSYFLQAYQGVYEPFFAFYGGTFYSVVGGVAAAIGGHPVPAFCGAIIAAFAGAYLGWMWLAHQVGLSGWRAQMPAALYVTAPYIITNPFGRGDVPEAVATAAIPLVAASGLALLRAERIRPLHATVFVLSVVWFTGTHNITTLWGTSFFAATAVVLVIAVGRHAVRARRVLVVLALAVLGLLVNAWFLFPTLAYSGTTAINAGGLGAFQFDSWGIVFDPLRSQGETSTAGQINTEMPVLAFGWALLVLAIAWRRLSGPWRRFAVGMLVIVVGLLWLILTNMSVLPRPWSSIQFPYRGQTYVALGVAALVLAGVAALPAIGSSMVRGIALVVLALIAVTSLGQTIGQQWSQPSELPTRQDIFQPDNHYPASWYSGFDYADVKLKPYSFGAIVGIPGVTIVGGNGESLLVIPVDGHADRSSVTFTSPGPVPIATNMYGGPYLIAIKGARIIGRTPSNEVVIQPLAPKGAPDKVIVSTAHSLPVVAGIIVTLGSILACLLLAALAVWRVVARRRVRLGPVAAPR